MPVKRKGPDGRSLVEQALSPGGPPDRPDGAVNVRP